MSITAERTTNPIETKHHVLVHAKPFTRQPNSYDMAIVTNELKESYSEQLPITKILEYFSKGHCAILCNAELDNENKFRFISSKLFAIDIDDEKRETNPKEVLMSLKDKAVGLFYTFSHGIKGNRYRLLFQLDQSVNDETKMKGIIEVVAKDLQAMGLPVDTGAKNTTVPIRGGRKGHIVANIHNQLNTSDLLERVKLESFKNQKVIYDEGEHSPIPFESLKEMAETIGHIPSGTGQYQLWIQLSLGIKHFANIDFITQDEGFELFDIISGGEQPQKSWEQLRARGQVTIGTLVREARNRGYKGKYTIFSKEIEIKEDFEKETIKVKDYIPAAVAKDLIERQQRILVDSPTGSGKTTSFLTAFKELSSAKKHFYIFAAPTRALTEQIALSHQVTAIKGKIDNLFDVILQDVRNGKRAFVVTYDMTTKLIEILNTLERNMSFTLVVDEFHKFVTDYDVDYRFKAIQQLSECSRQAKSFIGLSGTIDDIYKNEFDQVVKIDNGKPQSPCREFAVYTYEKRDQALVELAKLIEIWTSKRKLLIYIQSLKKIDQLHELLEGQGIKVRTINARNKKDPTYEKLVKTSEIDHDVQVVLTTSVIADGVNILNIQRDEQGNIIYDDKGKPVNDIEWEVIAVCNDFSNLFNYSAIKQISNRLRNTYRRFSIFMQEPKNDEQAPFYLESRYQYSLRTARRITDNINQDPYFDPLLFLASKVENHYGIHLGKENWLEIDTLYLRHKVSEMQERYFSGYRHSFIKAVEKALHLKSKGTLNISEKIQNDELDLTFIQEVLGQLQEAEKEKEVVKAESIDKAFTREVYQAFLDEDEVTIRRFKKSVTSYHYSCLQTIYRFADYETCRIVVQRVTRNAETHAFYKRIEALTESIYLRSISRPSATKKVLLSLLEQTEFVSKKDWKMIIEQIAKKYKVSVEAVRKVEIMVLFEDKRTKKERMKRASEPITAEAIAEEFGLTVEQVKNVAVNYAKTRGKTFEKVIRTKLNV